MTDTTTHELSPYEHVLNLKAPTVLSLVHINIIIERKVLDKIFHSGFIPILTIFVLFLFEIV